MTKASDNVFPKLIGAEGAAPGIPASTTAILYVKTDGLWYSKDDAGVETLVSGGGGGAPSDAQYLVGASNGSLSAEKVKAALYKNYDPDEYPAGASVKTEFDAGALDSGWAWGTAPATTEDYITYPGFGYFAHTTGNHWLAKAWTPGAVDVTIAAKLLISRTLTNSTDASSIMLGASDATGTDPTNGCYATLFPKQAAATGFQIYNKTGSYAAVGAEEALTGHQHSLTPIWLMLQRTNTGPVWRAYFSFNGITWTQHETTGSKALTIGAVSLRISDQTQIVAVDWIRCWDSLVTKVGV